MSDEPAELRRNVFLLLKLQAVTYVLPLVMTPYLVRVLGVERFGRIAFAMAIIHYFVVFTDYGFNLSATRQAAQMREDYVSLSRLFCAVFVIKAVLVLAGTVIFVLVVALIPALSNDWMLYFSVWIVVIGHLLFPVWLLQGIGRMEIVTHCMVGAQLAVLICIFTFVNEPGDYRIAAGLQASTPLLAGMLSFFMLRGTMRVSPLWPGIKVLHETTVAGWHVFISTMAISLYTATNTLVLGLLTNNTAVGHFAAADRLIKAVQGLVGPVSQSVFPHIARLQQREPLAALAFISRLLRWQGLSTFILSLAVFAFAGPLVDVLFGSQFEDSKLLVKLMAMIPFLVGLSNIFGMQIMLNFDMKRPFTVILLGSGIVNLFLLLVFVTICGLPGAALAVLVTETIVVLAMGVVLVRRGFGPALLGRS